MATVVGRYMFYPGSYFDTEIDTSKTPLLPGGTGAFANYSTWYRLLDPRTASIGGIYIDISGLANPGDITAADFTFRYGNDNFPDNWDDANAPDSVTVDEGAGVDGSDRIIIQWDISAVPNANWLQVTVLANDNTGLDTPDVFYWGLACGDTGNDPTNAIVTDGLNVEPPSDRDLVWANIHPFNSVPITNPYDMDKGGKVLSGDINACYTYATTEETALQLITPVVSQVSVYYSLPGTSSEFFELVGMRNDYPELVGSRN